MQLEFRRGAGVAGHSLDEEFLLGPVAGGEEQHAVAGQPVAAGPAGFLVIAREGFGQRVVGHQSDVGLVNAHSESDGGGDYGNRAVNKPFLGQAAGGGVQAGVIGGGGVALAGQILGQFLSFLAGKAIDDGGLAAPCVQQFPQGGGGSRLGADDVSQVGAVKAGDELRRIPQPELVNDVLAHPFRSGGRQGHYRRVGKQRPQVGQSAVVGAEIVSPFADAVGFVNSDEAQVQRMQKLPEAGHTDTLWGHVEQADPAGLGLALGGGGIAAVQAAVDEGGGDAVGPQGVHLVLHQGDEGRDHQGQPARCQRRQLVAQRLAAAGGHYDQAVAAGQGVGDDGFLPGPEGVVAEMPLEEGVEVVGRHCCAVWPGFRLAPE